MHLSHSATWATVQLGPTSRSQLGVGLHRKRLQKSAQRKNLEFCERGVAHAARIFFSEKMFILMRHDEEQKLLSKFMLRRAVPDVLALDIENLKEMHILYLINL